MTTDRELLEAAAKAVGIPIYEWRHNELTDSWHGARADSEEATVYWAPLTDDGDALRLAVKLRIDIEFQKPCGVAGLRRNHAVGTVASGYVSHIDCDPFAATRRAIVRAAAAIGEPT